MNIIEWAETLQGPTFLGALTGSSIAFIAAIIAALFNAHLNRQRDLQQTGDAGRALATALASQLRRFAATLDTNASDLERKNSEGKELIVPDLAGSLWDISKILDRLGSMRPETIEEVINAYGILSEYGQNLVAVGGHIPEGFPNGRVVVVMPGNAASYLANANRVISKRLKTAVGILEQEMHRIS